MTSAAPAPGPLTVLLVDDAEHLRYALRQVLETSSRAWAVVEAANGVEAQRLAAERCPDAVVLDHHMPLRTGLEALPHIRRSCPEAVIVMWTSQPDLAEQAAALGADAVVDKAEPFENLLAALRG